MCDYSEYAKIYNSLYLNCFISCVFHSNIYVVRQTSLSLPTLPALHVLSYQNLFVYCPKSNISTRSGIMVNLFFFRMYRLWHTCSHSSGSASEACLSIRFEGWEITSASFN